VLTSKDSRNEETADFLGLIKYKKTTEGSWMFIVTNDIFRWSGGQAAYQNLVFWA